MPPLVDGVGDYTCNLAREFARHGHKVYVACRADARIKADYDDIHVYSVVKRWDFGAARPIVRLIREQGIEVVSLQYVPHGFQRKGLPLALPYVMRKVKRCHVCVSIFFHEVYVQPQPRNLKRSVLSYGMQHIARCLMDTADILGTSIPYYKQMMQQVGGDGKEIHVIPIPSNVPLVHVADEELKALRRRIAPNGEPVIAFFGHRDLTSVLAALKELKEEGRKFVLLFIGKVSKTALAVKEQDGTWFTGELPISEIGIYFRVADMMILPTNKVSGNSFKSGALAAALQYGLPVVTVSGALTNSSLINGENVVFADFSSSNVLKACIGKLLDSATVRSKIRKGALKISVLQTVSKIYQSYVQIIELKREQNDEECINGC